jgi:hypothetical protein
VTLLRYGHIAFLIYVVHLSRNSDGYVLQVVDVDNVRQKATVKLIPRIDLQALASKLVSHRYTFKT